MAGMACLQGTHSGSASYTHKIQSYSKNKAGPTSYNPSTWVTAGGFHIPGQLGLHRETLFQKQKNVELPCAS